MTTLSALLSAPFSPRRVPLPTYAFERQRFWLEPRNRKHLDVASAGLASAGHPLLGAALPIAGSDAFILTGRLDLTQAEAVLA